MPNGKYVFDQHLTCLNKPVRSTADHGENWEWKTSIQAAFKKVLNEITI
jgi:hypothetical protein